MVKGVPPVISPELMGVLMQMGHGDELVLADGNFPAASVARRLLRADGHGVAPLLDAILQFLPLDPYVPRAVSLMSVVAGDTARTDIWDEYRRILAGHDTSFREFEMVERFAFYERAKGAYAVVATSETALYANIILRKGVVQPKPPAGR